MFCDKKYAITGLALGALYPPTYVVVSIAEEIDHNPETFNSGLLMTFFGIKTALAFGLTFTINGAINATLEHTTDLSLEQIVTPFTLTLVEKLFD